MDKKLWRALPFLAALFIVEFVTAHPAWGAELWVTPASDPADTAVGDWAATSSSQTRFSFAIPDDFNDFTGAKVIMICKQSKETEANASLSVSQNALRYDEYTRSEPDILITCVENELIEVNVSSIFMAPLVLNAGVDYASLSFEIKFARIVGLRFNYRSDVAAGLTAETTARVAGDAALQSAVEAETAARQSEITRLEELIAAIQIRVGENSAEIVTLGNDLNIETTQRSNGDAAVNDRVNLLESGLGDEVIARTNKDEHLQSQIDDFDIPQNLLDFANHIELYAGEVNDLAGPQVFFHSANFHFRNGNGNTDNTNGLGNVIIGYNEKPSVGYWPDDPRIGSHNLVVGDWNVYTSYGSFVAGRANIVSGPYSSVSGGFANAALDQFDSVSGGRRNTADGPSASVSGGQSNIASGSSASVSGGAENIADGTSSSVSGGHDNVASAEGASVSGGRYNAAIGEWSNIGGGESHTAIGVYDSDRTPDYDSGWVAIAQDQLLQLNHNLGGDPDNYIVDLQFNTASGVHNSSYGGFLAYDYDKDAWRVQGGDWRHLTDQTITIFRGNFDQRIDFARVRIWNEH